MKSSKLAQRIAKRLKDEFGFEVKPIIERTYTRTFDASEARFIMQFEEFHIPWYVRFEDTAYDIARAKKLLLYEEKAFADGRVQELTILIEER